MNALSMMTYRSRDPGDAVVIRASIEGSAYLAKFVMRSDILRERIEWTSGLIRSCLLSPVKEVRLGGLEGVAARKDREGAQAREATENEGMFSEPDTQSQKSGETHVIGERQIHEGGENSLSQSPRTPLRQ